VRQKRADYIPATLEAPLSLRRLSFILIGVEVRCAPEAALRKTWKEFALGLLNLLFVILIVAGAQPLARVYIPTMGPLLIVAVVLAAYWFGAKLIERRIPTELDPRRFPEGLLGLGIGLALFSAVMAVLWAAGAYHPSGWLGTSHLAPGLIFALLAGVLEEIIFRGFLFRLFAKILGTWGSLSLTAALFGLLHAKNPSATVGSSLAIAIEAGILLAAAYAATKHLWLPIGLHIGWNFCEGSVFGMTLSGNKMESGLIGGSLQGAPILTGGAFGPEASLVAVVLCFAVAVVFLWRTIKLERIEPAIWEQSESTASVAPSES
jgi:uncharacterized protein